MLFPIDYIILSMMVIIPWGILGGICFLVWVLITKDDDKIISCLILFFAGPVIWLIFFVTEGCNIYDRFKHKTTRA